jgi:hypothetical protein
MPTIILGAVSVLLMLMVPTVASVQIPKEGTATPSVATPDSATPQAALYAFSTTDGAWEISVTSAEFRNTVLNNVAKGIYVLVFLEVTNTSSLEDTFPYTAFFITDDLGNAYPAGNLTSEPQWSLARTLTEDSVTALIAPDQTIKTAVVIDVPVDATGLTISAPGWPAPIPLNR